MSHLDQGLPTELFFSDFQLKFCMHFSCPIRATFPTWQDDNKTGNVLIDEYGRIILKCVLEKYDLRIW
jgi:hypothetical protein